MDSSRILSTRLAELLPAMNGEEFEDFWLSFFNSGVRLKIPRRGTFVDLRVRSANRYGVSGHTQKGVDLRGEMEDDTEVAAQCKRHKSWTPAQTKAAIQEGAKYQAAHHLLILACDASPEVHDVVRKAPGWELWDLSRICAELRVNVPADKLPRVLSSILPQEEIKRFTPFATTALREWKEYFERFKSVGLHHDWKLVGRDTELRALHDFVAAKGEDAKPALVVTAPGGVGKTRLLRALGESFTQKHRKKRLLFFDPTSHDRTWPALLDGPVVVVVDDAHRLEQVPMELLAHIRDRKEAQLILVARPQGEAELRTKLRSVGLGKEDVAQLKVPKLTRDAVRLLAEEALGPEFLAHAAALTELTRDCALLTVLAGEMVQRRQLRWGAWSGAAEFRGIVFERFEAENLQSLSEDRRPQAAELLRILAMLAPARADAAFFAKAAECMGVRDTEVELLLLHLREVELVVGRDETARILPDLFADFLVYDACFDERKRRRLWTQKVLKAFGEARPVLLRNLAEAAWVDERGEERAAEVLAPLLQKEMEEFAGASFYERARIVESWSQVAAFLPTQALDLAKLALRLTTAPPMRTEELGLRPVADVDCQEEVLTRLPGLLEPVAAYHSTQQEEALNILLDLGLRPLESSRWQESKHPWDVIARVADFAVNKFLGVSHGVVSWLDKAVTRQAVLAELSRPSTMLRTLTAPFFAKTYEWHEDKRDGASMSMVIHTHAVPIGTVSRKASAKLTAEERLTQSANQLRESALGLLGKLAETTNWTGALSVISALEEAIERVNDWRIPGDAKHSRKNWRPVRRAGLAILKKILSRHDHVVIRYRTRQLLRNLCHYEEDTIFKRDGERLLAEVREDLALRTCIVVFSYAHDEFLSDFEVESFDVAGESDRKWSGLVTQVADGLATSYPTAAALAGFLAGLAGDMERAGYTPHFTTLLAEILTRSPAMVDPLISRLLADGVPTSLARSAPFLAGHATLEASRFRIWQLAVESKNPVMLPSVVSAITWRMRGGAAMEEERELLLEIAGQADATLARTILEALRQMPIALQPLTYAVIERLPLAELAAEKSASLLHALAPEAARDRGIAVSPSEEALARILAKLVPVPHIDLFQQDAPFTYLAKSCPQAVFNFLRARIIHAESLSEKHGYAAFPLIRLHLDFPRLEQAVEFSKICAELWQKATEPAGREQFSWRRLFQAVVLPHAAHWLPHLEQAVGAASSLDALTNLVDLIHFDGSLLAFRQPRLVQALLARAEALGGSHGRMRMQSSLYHASGPFMRGYTNGRRDHGDYLLMEARKALERDKGEPLLVEFYQYAIQAEERDAEDHQQDFENRRKRGWDEEAE